MHDSPSLNTEGRPLPADGVLKLSLFGLTSVYCLRDRIPVIDLVTLLTTTHNQHYWEMMSANPVIHRKLIQTV